MYRWGGENNCIIHKSVLLSFDLHTYGEMYLAPDVRDFTAIPCTLDEGWLQQLVLFEVGRLQSS